MEQLKVRDKPKVRLDPSLRYKVNVLAAQYEVTNNEMLETLIQLGIKALAEKDDVEYPERPRRVA